MMVQANQNERRLRFLSLCLACGIFSSNRVSVQAFTSRNIQSISSTTRIPTRTNNEDFLRIPTQRGVAIEEDLDAALDSLLGDAFKDASEPSHMEDSHPIPRNLLEEVSCFRF